MLRVLGAEAGKGGAKCALQRGEVFLARAGDLGEADLLRSDLEGPGGAVEAGDLGGGTWRRWRL